MVTIPPLAGADLAKETPLMLVLYNVVFAVLRFAISRVIGRLGTILPTVLTSYLLIVGANLEGPNMTVPLVVSVQVTELTGAKIGQP